MPINGYTRFVNAIKAPNKLSLNLYYLNLLVERMVFCGISCCHIIMRHVDRRLGILLSGGALLLHAPEHAIATST